MTPFEAFTLVGLIGMPALGLMLTRQDKHRETHFAMIDEKISGSHTKLDHLDECVDEVKEKMATKADLLAHQNDTRAALELMRSSVDRATDGLHQRLLRLEAPYFGGRQNGAPSSEPGGD